MEQITEEEFTPTDQNGANRLCVLEVENLFSRQAIEDDLLCRYNTPCNRIQ